MRILPLLVAIGLGCAAMARPPERHYRVSGLGATLTPNSSGHATYVVHVDAGIEYTVEAIVTSGVVRLRTVIRNGGREPVRYDLQRMVVAAADGAPLRLAGTEEESSSRPTESERASGEYVRGARAIAPGQWDVVTRRYELADGLRRGRDALLLARVSLSDVARLPVPLARAGPATAARVGRGAPGRDRAHEAVRGG